MELNNVTRLQRGKPEILWDVQQGTQQWKDIRKGVPTCSAFGKIMTNELKLSSSNKKYMRELCGGLLGGEPEFKGNKWTDRGNELEDEARKWYAFDQGVEVAQCGFVYLDDRRLVGGSPDGLVGDEGGIEIKCPSAAVHVEYMLANSGKKWKVPMAYLAQVRGLLWLTDRQWWDFVSYYPGAPSVVVRVHRDDEHQQAWEIAWEERLVKFMAEYAGMRKKLGLVFGDNVEPLKMRKKI